MNELLSLNIRCDGSAVYTKELSDSHFSLDLHSDSGARILECNATFSFNFEKEDRLFLNGYQSWTGSRERSVNDIDNSMRFCPRLADKKFHFSSYGDGHFYRKKYRAGLMHGYSYAYIRRCEKFFLIGSLSENTGFTRIIFDTKNSTITLEKDCIDCEFLGDYRAFSILFVSGTENEVFDRWFSELGVTPKITESKSGYTSWYNYYQDITENIILSDLNAIAKLPSLPDIFQIDDGYECAVGDWLKVDKMKFPNGLTPIAKAIRNAGCVAGIWLAPFVAEYGSDLYREHPEWFLRTSDGKTVPCGSNWGGMAALDLSFPEVREYIRLCIQEYKNQGFQLFKLDFLYAACMLPRRCMTRGEVMYDAMDFLREAVGEECEILACGVPLLPAFGKVEYCRIGMDMSLSWDDAFYMRLFHSERPSTKNTMLNTIYRRELNGRAFLCDPDVFLLRDYKTKLTEHQRLALATVNALFGGLLFVSDNFDRYNEQQRVLYQNILELRDASDIHVNEHGGKITLSYALNGTNYSLEYKIAK